MSIEIPSDDSNIVHPWRMETNRGVKNSEEETGSSDLMGDSDLGNWQTNTPPSQMYHRRERRSRAKSEAGPSRTRKPRMRIRALEENMEIVKKPYAKELDAIYANIPMEALFEQDLLEYSTSEKFS
ncbi:hypothetical protein L1987_40186 [Smallanthus sonchifolius]|uniref:Uncharacterized protein n=1 Tax=Smallanthus sonchifolius TaxID=185202 RepID=A0ACB9GTI2_9ASTR|nr:hypothetical protein L1987_40186 [Smallanthus sonchifolius]